MRERIDVKKLTSQLTLEMYETLFKALDIPIYSKSKDKWILYTGCHNRNALQGSPKLYFYLDTKVFFCYTHCNSAMGIVNLTMKRLALLGEDGGFLNAVNFILSKTGLDKDSVSRISAKKYTYDWEQDFGKFIRFKSGISELPIYDKNILQGLSGSVPQTWIDEGISIEAMRKYQIGYYERLNQTTIPCFNRDGELIGIRVRNWNPELVEAKKKYMPLIILDGTCYKFPTDNIFYGMNFNWPEIERTKTCYIGESEKFVLKMETWFGIHSTALGMFGSNLGLRRRNELLKMGVERIVYVPDNDFKEYGSEEYKEWEKKIQKFVALFKGYCDIEIVWDTLGVLGYKDNATDKDRATWDLLYEGRQIWKMKEGKDND